jgi:hypothetical protein
MQKSIQKLLISILILAISIPFLGNIGAKADSQPIISKIARAQAVANIENIEKISIKSTKSNDVKVQSAEISAPNNESPDYSKGEMIVKFKTLESRNSYLKEKGLNPSDFSNSRLINLELGDNFTTKQTDEEIAKMGNDDRVLYAEPNAFVQTLSIPNDPFYSKQWSLYNDGSLYTNTTAGYDVEFEAARDIQTGSPNTVIAVMDFSIDFPAVPQLADSIYRDANGKVIGRNTASNCDFTDATGNLNASCPTASPTDHGVWVSGIIGAKTNDGVGMAGICNTCKIMPMAIRDNTTGTVTVASLVTAINYAVANGADIINMSLRQRYMNSMRDAVDNAISAGVFVVASAGNCGRSFDPLTYATDLKNNSCYVSEKNNSSYPVCIDPLSTAAQLLAGGCTAPDELNYPAGYDNVISVAGYDTDGVNRIYTANRKVSIAAPGSSILTTSSFTVPCSTTVTTSCCPDTYQITPADKLCYVNGSSFATPIVAGILGLAKSKDPTITPSNFNILQLSRGAKQYSNTKNPTLVGKLGSGSINACAVLGGCLTNAELPYFQIGLPSAYGAKPVTGKIGTAFPIIALEGTTLPQNTPATIQLPGCTVNQYVTGFLRSDAFVPTSGQLIPACTTLGTQSSTLRVTVSNGAGNSNYSTSFDSNFIAASSTAQILGSSLIPVTGNVGSALLPIPLSNNTIPDNTIAEFAPGGCEDPILPTVKGKIIGNKFVPDAPTATIPNTVPFCSVSGRSAGTIFAPAHTVGILTDLSPSWSPVTPPTSTCASAFNPTLAQFNSCNLKYINSAAIDTITCDKPSINPGESLNCEINLQAGQLYSLSDPRIADAGTISITLDKYLIAGSGINTGYSLDSSAGDLTCTFVTNIKISCPNISTTGVTKTGEFEFGLRYNPGFPIPDQPSLYGKDAKNFKVLFNSLANTTGTPPTGTTTPGTTTPKGGLLVRTGGTRNLEILSIIVLIGACVGGATYKRKLQMKKIAK